MAILPLPGVPLLLHMVQQFVQVLQDDFEVRHTSKMLLGRALGSANTSCWEVVVSAMRRAQLQLLQGVSDGASCFGVGLEKLVGAAAVEVDGGLEHKKGVSKLRVIVKRLG